MLQKNWGKDIDKMRVCDRMSQQVSLLVAQTRGMGI
jgi:hypothetical protein